MTAQNWVLIISEQHRYQGVSYKSDIIVISGLDLGDRQALEQKYAGCDPPCLLDSSDGRWNNSESLSFQFDFTLCSGLC